MANTFLGVSTLKRLPKPESPAKVRHTRSYGQSVHSTFGELDRALLDPLRDRPNFSRPMPPGP